MRTVLFFIHAVTGCFFHELDPRLVQLLSPSPVFRVSSFLASGCSGGLVRGVCSPVRSVASAQAGAAWPRPLMHM